MTFPHIPSAIGLAVLLACAGCGGGGGGAASNGGTAAAESPPRLAIGNGLSRELTPRNVAAEINGAGLDRVRAVWSRLGLERPGLRPTTFNKIGKPPEYAAGPFTAEVFRMELDGTPTGVNGGSDAIVRIGDPAAWDWQILAFIDTPSGWRFAGAVDLPDQRVGAPAPRVRSLGPRLSWLTVPVNKLGAAPAADRELAWYQVRDGRLVEVLRTPSEGSRAGTTASFDVAYRAVVLDLFLTPDNIPAMTMQLEAVYTNARRDAFPGLKNLFKRTGVVRYAQRGDNGRFVLEPGSDWSADELAGLLTESSDQFVHNNRVQVVEMARSSDVNRRQWVARLRQDCRSPEVRQELGVLATADGEP